MDFEVILSEDEKDKLRKVDNVESLLSFLKERGLDVSREVAENLFSVTLREILQWMKSEDYRKTSAAGIESLRTSKLEDGTLHVWGREEETIGLIIHIPNYTPGEVVTEYESVSYISSLPSPENILPNIVSSLGEDCFSGCESLEKIVIPYGITRIPYESFFGCRRLKEVIIPDTVVSIDPGAFCGCKDLRQIELPKHLKYIGACAFFGCESLRNIAFPESLEDIGYAAFKDCLFLSAVSVPIGYTIPYERHVFDGCRSLNISDVTIDYCQFDIDKIINELASCLDILSSLYLDGVNSQYFFHFCDIDQPEDTEIGAMVDVHGDDFFDYLIHAIVGGWVFFKEGSLLQSNIKRIDNSSVKFIYMIISYYSQFRKQHSIHCLQVMLLTKSLVS